MFDNYLVTEAAGIKATSARRFQLKLRNYSMVFSAVIAISSLAYWWAAVIPRRQICEQSLSQITIALGVYIDRFGSFPNRQQDMEDAGLLKSDSEGNWEIPELGRTVLKTTSFQINWGFESANIDKIDGKLIDRKTKEAVLIIDIAGDGCLESRPFAELRSIQLFDALVSHPGRRK